MTAAQEAEHAAASDDERLMAMVVAGSTGALAELYDRFGSRAYRVARAVCGDDGAAEDAVEQAFVAIWRAPMRHLAAEQVTVSGWVLATVNEHAVDAARRQATLRSPPDDAAGLSAALRRLPEAQRRVITLAFFGELTHGEIAAALDLPSGTVKGRMRLGLTELRVCSRHIAP